MQGFAGLQITTIKNWWLQLFINTLLG